jgi:hypothetical protein
MIRADWQVSSDVPIPFGFVRVWMKLILFLERSSAF